MHTIDFPLSQLGDEGLPFFNAMLDYMRACNIHFHVLMSENPTVVFKTEIDKLMAQYLFAQITKEKKCSGNCSSTN